MKTFSLPPVPENERTPLINMLFKVIEQQQETIAKLEENVTTLKDEVTIRGVRHKVL